VGASQGTVYLVFRNFRGGGTGSQPGGIYIFKSTNGGNSFSPAGSNLANSLVVGEGLYNVQGAWVCVGPDHAVYVFWLDQSAGAGTPNLVKMRKSTNQGATFGAAVTVATLNETGVNGDLSLTGGFRSSCFAQAVVNPVSGHIYVVYPDDPAPLASGDGADIYFKMSTDGGNTWSAAVRVNDDTTLNEQFMPVIAVKPDGTGLFIAWYDRRRDTGNYLIERWGVVASVSGSTVTFGTNFRISPQFPVVVGQDSVINATYMGDYDQAVADNSFYYTTWSDNRLGNSFHAHEPDARFAKIPVGGPGPIVDFVSATLGGSNLNGQIDPNECNTLIVTIQNNGGLPATAVTATLATTTPGVTITGNTSDYPNLAPGTTAANATLFEVSSDPTLPCGSTVNFALTLAYAGGSDTLEFSLTARVNDYVVTESTGAIDPGTTDIGNHCDDCYATISLPFPVALYGQTFNSVTPTSNGNLIFGTPNAGYANFCLPASGFTATIFAHWDDLRTDGTGNGIFTSVTGVAPNRVFNIEWRAAYYSAPTSPVNFEVRLYENSASFDVIYGTVTQSGASSTEGVQKDTTSFTQYRCNAGGLVSGLKTTYSLPGCLPGLGPCGPVICDPDTTPPYLRCPGQITSNADPTCHAAVPNILRNVIVVDNCTGVVTLVQSPAAGTVVGLGANNIVVVATDAASNTSTCTTAFVVLDTSLRITCPGSITVTNTPGLCGANVSYTVTASDNCSTVGIVSTPPSGSFFPVGATTVTAIATNTAGNAVSCSFTVRVVDGEPPRITCPAPVTKTTNKCALNVTYPAPTATDNCAVSYVTSTPPSGSSFPIGTNLVTCTAVDVSGNSVTCTFPVIVRKSGGKPCR
jgi:hypothetical protein